jgi:hypothetical protein
VTHSAAAAPDSRRLRRIGAARRGSRAEPLTGECERIGPSVPKSGVGALACRRWASARFLSGFDRSFLRLQTGRDQRGLCMHLSSTAVVEPHVQIRLRHFHAG